MFYAPCSSSLPPTTVCPPQYASNESLPVELTRNGKVRKPRRPRQPKANARPRGGNQRRKTSAPESLLNGGVVSNVAQWHSQMGGPTVSGAQCSSGPPKVRDALLKSLLQSSHPADPPPTRCSSSSSLCSPVPDPAPIMRSSSDTQPSFAYHEPMWPCSIADDTQSECLSCIASTSSNPLPQSAMYQTTMTSSQPVLTGGFMPSGMPSSASVPQMGSLYNTQMSSSPCCSYTNSPVGPTNECSMYSGMPSMVGTNSAMVQINCGNTEQMRAPMMQSSQTSVQQQSQIIQQQSLQQQWNTPQQEYIYQQQTAMYQQVPTSGITQMKASPLKRKTTMPQAASTAHELPSKLAHMNQAQYTPYQQSSPQYQQSVASPQFATQSATSVNRLSSYGSYDGSQNTVCVMNSVGQWSKRPPSRSELIRLELRHSVQARQHAASPSQPGVLSPNDLGAPRFAGVSQYAQMISPRMAPQSPSQQVQQQAQSAVIASNSIVHSTNSPQMMVHDQSSSNQQSNPAPYYINSEGAPIGSMMTAGYSNMPPAINDSNMVSATPTPVIPTELYDFNLGNGGFDMDNDATRSLVQKLLS
uniref:Uncharacterized protein n=1 Tax=Parascaris univalens TaxID=6257 RepID=A0A914ZDD8_PARUN